MFYIPKDWIKNKDNESSIHQILDKYFYTDLKSKDMENNIARAIQELEEIDETIIIQKLNNNEICFGA